MLVHCCKAAAVVGCEFLEADYNVIRFGLVRLYNNTRSFLGALARPFPAWFLAKYVTFGHQAAAHIIGDSAAAATPAITTTAAMLLLLLLLLLLL